MGEGGGARCGGKERGAAKGTGGLGWARPGPVLVLVLFTLPMKPFQGPSSPGATCEHSPSALWVLSLQPPKTQGPWCQ